MLYLCIMNKEILIDYINQGLSTWKIAEKLNTNQTQVRNWLKQHDLKTNRKTNGLENKKLCPKCKVIKSKNDFYISTKSSSFCKSCIIISNKERQKKTKQLAVEYKGGKCIKCGYNKCLAALEFHHINPNTKDKDYFNSRGGLSESLKSELDKCVLLCANCHREEHHLH